MTREDELKQALHSLHIEYRARAEPLLRELAQIEARKPPRHVIWWDEASNITPEMMQRITGVTPEMLDYTPKGKR